MKVNGNMAVAHRHGFENGLYGTMAPIVRHEEIATRFWSDHGWRGCPHLESKCSNSRAYVFDTITAVDLPSGDWRTMVESLEAN